MCLLHRLASLVDCETGVANHHELINLLRFSFRFSRSTRLRCIVSAIFSYRSRSSFLARFSRILSIFSY